MTYAISLIDRGYGACAALEYDGRLYPLASLLPGLAASSGDLVPYFDHWDEVIRTIDAAVSLHRLPDEIGTVDETRFLAPIQRPTNIICAGSNYYDHLLKDFGITSFDKSANDILYFTKQAGSLVGPGRTVRYPSQSVAFDWEIELVVVIGRSGRRIPIESAMEHVAGYMVGLDLTARDLQFNKRQRRQFDLFGGKSFDDSAPTGPRIVPARFVDPDDLTLTLRVNGEVKQNSHTREMIWGIAELIADVSQHVTLRPGDLLFTGSPAGVGHASGTYLKIGDHIEAEIGDLGQLAVEIVEDPDSARVWNRQELLAAAQSSASA